jgi:hypothetical protein
VVLGSKDVNAQAPRSRKTLFDGAIYKNVNTVKRGDISLGLKRREDQNYFTTAWRASRSTSGTNRRFYLEQGEFWEMYLKISVEMLDEAHARGLLSQKYSRWPDTKIQVFDSKGIIGDSRPELLEEILTSQNGLESLGPQAFYPNADD